MIKFLQNKNAENKSGIQFDFISKVLFNQFKSTIMGNLLYTVAVILIIIWAIGFLGFAAGGIIHILLVIAVIAILLRVIQGRKPL